MNIQVQAVSTAHDDVVVTFSDGHSAIFDPYTHGWGYQVEGMRRFHLKKGQQEVCRFNGRLYRAGPQENECKLVRLADGYTQQQVAAYWQAAREYLNREYYEKHGSERLWYPWILVCTEGSHYYQLLTEGRATMVSEQEDE